jgi:hypothetical protein
VIDDFRRVVVGNPRVELEILVALVSASGVLHRAAAESSSNTQRYSAPRKPTQTDAQIDRTR